MAKIRLARPPVGVPQGLQRDDEGLRRPLGPRGGPYADDAMAELIAHINREVMHHGAEICLLRDLYRATGATSRASRLVVR